MRKLRSQGQALTEFVLIIPLFLFILLGAVQVSHLYLAFQVVHYASFAASRAAIVRPCAAFQPDDSLEEHFTPAVFSAAVFSNMAVASMHDFSFDNPFEDWLPRPPDTPQVANLDYNDIESYFTIADIKYFNAASLTSVRRVYSTNLGVRPVEWNAINNGNGAGPGLPCQNADGSGSELSPEQNVPPPGHDLSLEVIFIYPMTIPFANQVIYGIFTNFGSLSNDLGLAQIGTEKDDVMVRPVRLLTHAPNWELHIRDTLLKLAEHYSYDDEASVRMGILAFELADRNWYPLPIRARCTLTTEGTIRPLISPRPF